MLLKVREPGLERLLAEASIPTELDVRDAARPSPSPDPVLRHAEPLGYVIDGEQPGHIRQAGDGTVPAIEFLGGRLPLAVA